LFGKRFSADEFLIETMKGPMRSSNPSLASPPGRKRPWLTLSLCGGPHARHTVVSVKSSDSQKIPVGIQLKDRIISISDAELIFQPLEGYDESAPRRVTRKRTKDGF
jgi:hypothetical protein